jgi:SAM-dependent methyltransferase
MNTAKTPLLGINFTSLEGCLPIPVTPQGEEARRAVRAKIVSGEYALEVAPCLCGAQEDRLVATIDRYRIPHATVLCRRCGLVRTNPRLTEAAYVDFYTHHYRDLYERANHEPVAYYAAQLVRGQERAAFILRHVRAGWDRPAVLEIGCGGGWNLLPFHAQGWGAVGWDFDDDYLAAGRAKGLDLRHGSLDDAAARGERFELIILSHVLEHLLEPAADLRKLRALLTPRGALFIEVPSLFDVSSNLLRYFQNAHTFSFVPDTLQPLMASTGFRCLAMTSRIQSLWMADEMGSAGEWRKPALAARTENFLRRRQHESKAYQRWRGLQLRCERAWERLPFLTKHTLE